MIELILSGAAGAVAGGYCVWPVLAFRTKLLTRRLADVTNDRDYLERRLFAVGAELGEIKARDEARKAQCRAAAAKWRLSQKMMAYYFYAQYERALIGDAIDASFIRVVRP